MVEETQPANGYENSKEEEEDTAFQIEQCNGRGSRGSGSRRTRSQAAPDWTVQESMVLVNELAATDRDWHKSLSSFQKWKIIVDNCSGLDVPRNLNQCRRQWDSLFSDYNKIKKWESDFKPSSYFSLESEKRREFGVPENFDADLFRVIDNYVRAQEGKSDTDPDSDPDAGGDAIDDIDDIPESGPKKRRSKAMLKKHGNEKRVKDKKDMKKVPQVQITVEPRVKNPENSFTEWKKPEQRSGRREPKVKAAENIITDENMSAEDKSQLMATKLREDLELINATLEGNLTEDEDYVLADLKNPEVSQTRFVRRQGDRLISCFENLVDTLDQLCDLVQKRN